MNIFFIVIFDQKSFTKESIYIFLQFRKWFKNNISNHSRKLFIDPFLSNFSIYLFIYFHLFIFPPLSSRSSSPPPFFILLFPRYGIEDKSVLKVIADWRSFHFELIVRFRFQDGFTYPR